MTRNRVGFKLVPEFSKIRLNLETPVFRDVLCQGRNFVLSEYSMVSSCCSGLLSGFSGCTHTIGNVYVSPIIT